MFFRANKQKKIADAVLSRAGSGLDIVSPGASEDSKIAGEMLRMLYYQHVIDNHKTS